MAQKRKRSGRKQEPSRPHGRESGPTRALGLAPGAERVLVLGRERDRLVTEVGQKKRVLERCEAQVERAREALSARLGGLVSERHSIDTETHAWFVKLLVPGRLAKRKRRKVLTLYRFLQEEEVLSPREVDAADDGGFAPREAASDDAEWASGEEREPRLAASAPKVAAVGRDALRALFKRLAVALHPDRARSLEDKARLTEVMKEVTRAYEQQDLASLLEIERREDGTGALGAAAASTPHDERARALEHAIQELRRQLRELSKSVKDVKRSEAYELAQGIEQGGPDPILEIERAARADLERLRGVRDYARDFSEGKLSFEQFIEGPPPSPAEEAAFEAALDALLEGFAHDVEPPRRGKRRRGPPSPDDIPF